MSNGHDGDPTDPPLSEAETVFPELPAKVMRSRAMGKFYALVIGNNNYQTLPTLQTAHNDARRIAKILSGAMASRPNSCSTPTKKN